MGNEALTILWALVSAVGFGLALVTTRLGLRDLPAAAGARLSVPTTALLLWILAPWLASWPSPAPWAALAIFATVGVAFPAWVTLLTFEANRRLGPTLTGTLGAVTPLFSVLGGVLLLRESPTAAELAGTGGVVLGVMVLTGSGAVAGGWTRWSLALPVAAALIRALAQVGTKAGLALVPQPFLAALVGYTVSAAIVFAFARWLAPAQRVKWRPGGVGWFMLSGLGNGGSVLALYTALQHGPIAVVAPVAAGFPVVTYGASILLFPEERHGLRRLAGVALVVGGVVLVVL
jgi:drug/metabolite transporter (DMT)-like permease